MNELLLAALALKALARNKMLQPDIARHHPIIIGVSAVIVSSYVEKLARIRLPRNRGIPRKRP